MKDDIDLKNIEHILHVLRNPYGWNDHIVKDVRLAAANEIEKLQSRLSKLELELIKN